MSDVSQSCGNWTVILADGEFPRRADHLELLRRAAFIVACDGAAVSLLEFGREPDAVVGDLDSLPENVRAHFEGKLFPVGEQESNDLCKAFRWVASHCPNTPVAVLGAAGKREDHLLGNLAVFASCGMLLKTPPLLLTEYGTFYLLPHSGALPCLPGQQISIFSFDPACEITSEGLKYPLKRMRLEWWFEATLNEALDDTFSLAFEGTKPLLVFMTDPAQRGRQFAEKGAPCRR